MMYHINKHTGIMDRDTDEFLELTDVDIASFEDKGGYVLAVNPEETAIELPDEITFGDITFEARTAMTTPSADEMAGPYLTTTGTTPNRVVELKMKDEQGNEVILYSYKV